MVARWSANPLGILWPKRDARLLSFFQQTPRLVSVLGGIGA
jgi:hypothetical protein